MLKLLPYHPETITVTAPASALLLGGRMLLALLTQLMRCRLLISPSKPAVLPSHQFDLAHQPLSAHHHHSVLPSVRSSVSPSISPSASTSPSSSRSQVHQYHQVSAHSSLSPSSSSSLSISPSAPRQPKFFCFTFHFAISKSSPELCVSPSISPSSSLIRQAVSALR